MKNPIIKICYLLFILAMLISAGCSGTTPAVEPPGNEQSAGEPANQAPDNNSTQGQPTTEAIQSAQTGNIFYYALFPMEVTSNVANIKVVEAAAPMAFAKTFAMLILENTSTDPMDLYSEVIWTVKLVDKDGNTVGELDHTDSGEVFLPPGYRSIVRAAELPMSEGEEAKIVIEITEAKKRNLQDYEMGGVNHMLPYPIFKVEGGAITTETHKGLVISQRASTTAVVTNPLGQELNLRVVGVIYTADGKMAGVMYPTDYVKIAANGTVEVKMISDDLCGPPDRVVYYVEPFDPYELILETPVP